MPSKDTALLGTKKVEHKSLFDEEDDLKSDLFGKETKSSLFSSKAVKKTTALPPPLPIVKEAKSPHSDDFEALYLAEKAKTIELEALVLDLQQTVAELFQKLHLAEQQHTSSTLFTSDGNTSESLHMLDAISEAVSEDNLFDLVDQTTDNGNTIDGATTAEANNWEKLANEERERRQRSRQVKSKSRPVSMSVKRLSALTGTTGSGTSTAGKSAEVSPVAAAPAVAAAAGVKSTTNSTAWDASDSEEETKRQTAGGFVVLF